jgi:hypothetical protein
MVVSNANDIWNNGKESRIGGETTRVAKYALASGNLLLLNSSRTLGCLLLHQIYCENRN